MESLGKFQDKVRDSGTNMIFLSDDAGDIRQERGRTNLIQSVVFEVNRQIARMADEVIMFEGAQALKMK